MLRAIGTLVALALPLVAATAHAKTTPPRITFLEREDTGEAELPIYRVLDDSGRIATYLEWLDNESARWAIDLYERAMALARETGRLPDAPNTYYILLVPGGNHGDVGFRLRDTGGVIELPRTPYMKLGPDEWRFGTTFLHETGHVVTYALAGGRRIPGRNVSSIPHTTAALTNRGTAFSEGFAIHLETLLAHIGSEPGIADYYRHARFRFGVEPGFKSEYFRQSSDLMTFAQSRARYDDVRENAFAFVAAFKGPDYLRAQLETARDFATLRDANQLLQSEGFYASFFFGLLVRGAEPPTREELLARQGHVLEALASMFEADPAAEDSPHLIRFLTAYTTRYPDEADEVIDVFLDLTHGVFVDPQAMTLWRDHYLAALRLDLDGLNREGIAAARRGWHEAIELDPQILYSRLGPQLVCQAPGAHVRLVAFGETMTLSFDLNTAEEGVIRSIPGVTPVEVERWLSERARQPFADIDDFLARVRPAEALSASMRCDG